jgi:SAM-dependent methyltransferase
MNAAEIRFDFGKNWQSFVDRAVNADRLAAAVASMRRLLCGIDLGGKSFLDIGCGSGLSSLAAIALGAERVVGFDYDPHSVQASLSLRERAGIGANTWVVTQGSILDVEFLGTLPRADVVYSWGVLHHTGAMWQAIDNAVGKLQPHAVFALAIYNNVERRFGGSAMWWHLKRAYNRAPAAVRLLMEWVYIANFAARNLLTLRNPLTMARQYSEHAGRGMDFRHDVRDWLGGFPYEYATAGAVFNYLHGQHGLQLEYLNTHDGHECNEFTFRRPG